MSATLESDAALFAETFHTIRTEVGKLIVGQKDIIEHVLTAICCGGHVLLEGVPGLGKTALVNTLAKALDLKFGRIQFTPDLLPSDVVGTQVLSERDGRRELIFQRGPVFCNILLADEINRATPKTQSALLETMQEKRVTVAGVSHSLDQPFFVLATQNPIENDGTYPLPEAQLDRFFFKLLVTLPDHDDFAEILNRTGGNFTPEINPVAHGEDILRMGRTLREIPVGKDVQDHLIRIVRNTHPENEKAPDKVKKYVRNGASPRAAQAMLAAARVRALLDGRFHVAREDVDAVAGPALCHRLILSFEGEAEGIKPTDLVKSVIRSAYRSMAGEPPKISPGDLTGAAFIRRLETLFLLVRRVLGGSMQADRKSTRKGTGITFADYAEYRLGDDYRAIDWRVYARFDELVIKLFELEEDATVYILLDLSRSMATKTSIARKLAAALGYIGLSCQDRVAVYGMADELRPLLEATRGRSHVLPFLRSLELAPEFGADTDFSTAVKTLQVRHRKRGLVIVISDFFFPTGFEEGLKRLSGLGHDVHALQVLSEEDLVCHHKGDVELECVESGKQKRVTITSREADAYAKAVTDWNERLRSECARRGIGFTRTMADDAFDEVIRTILQKGGLAR